MFSMRWFPRLIVVMLGATSLLSGASLPRAGSEWEDLFDGSTLNGWVKRGGKATYRVEDGEIVGTTVPNTANTFLCSERDFGDFVLELEFKVHPNLNSGIQVRSQVRENGRVFGYQVEIDPSSRAWSAGIYDEARRGWLDDHKDNEPARKAFKKEAWNHVRIVCRGDSLRTWLNGVAAADLVDSTTLKGFIGLQVHGVGGRKDPLTVRWRKIRILDLGEHRWEPLFDGESLAGWHTRNGGSWTVEDGVLVGRSTAAETRNGLLVTDRRFHDVTARIKYRAHQGNSGLFFRVDEVDGPAGVRGFQAEIDPERETGKLYETGGRGDVARPREQDVAKWLKKGDWNQLTVSAHMKRLVVHLNDRRTVELRDDPGRMDGHLALQLHRGETMHVEFKRIEVLRRVVREATQDHQEHVLVHTAGEYRGEPFGYRLMAPSKIEPGVQYPLVLFLHGAGERGDDNARQLTYLPNQMAQREFRDRYPCYVRG